MAFGSAYYHLKPDGSRVMWDILPVVSEDGKSVKRLHSLTESDMEELQGPTFDIIGNLTESEPQNDALPNDDENRPYFRTGLHDYPPDHIIPKKKKGRSIAKNVDVQKKKEKGEPFDIEILQPYAAICGDDAANLKTEICCLIRYHVPHNVMSWTYIKDDVRQVVWMKLKSTFALPESFYDYVMKQVGAQFRYRHNKLHTLYKNGKGCPADVDGDQWKWLVDNKWENEKFKVTFCWYEYLHRPKSRPSGPSPAQGGVRAQVRS